MEKSKIVQLGWGIFTLFFLMGNICLFGFIATENEDFAVGGFFLLIYGSMLNLMILLVFIICAFIDKRNKGVWFKSALILLLNIPIALVYAYIGLEIS